MDYAIVDLDGTVSDCAWRAIFATDAKLETDRKKKAERWDEFHQRCGLDQPHLGEVLLVQAWIKAGNKAIFLTGRPNHFRVLTQDWLAVQGLPRSPLFMRQPGNYASTAEYKLAIVKQIERNVFTEGDRIAFILEDKQDVVDMWRREGYTCLQPRPSAF